MINSPATSPRDTRDTQFATASATCASRQERMCTRVPAQVSEALSEESASLGVRLNVDSGLLALLRGDWRRCARQRVHATAGLWERDHVADRVGSRQQGADPVPTERDPSMRRRAVVERIQQEAKSFLRLLFRQPHHREDALLDVSAMDTDRAAADLIAIADDVVGPRKR